MPPVMRKRGHPKGHEVTVIGLPAKRPRGKQKHSDQKERVVPLSNFILRSKREVASYTAFRFYSVEFRGYDNDPCLFCS